LSLHAAVCRGPASLFVALVVASATALAQAPSAERYLVVGASAGTPAAIAHKAKALAEAVPGGGLVATTADCGDRRPVFVWLATVADSPAAAKAALTQLRERVPDASLRRCTPRPDSLLALGVPAVDASIAQVPADAVNWRDADRVSGLLDLRGPGDPAFLVLQRVHVATPDDLLEGRRTRVLLPRAGATPKLLLEDCGGARDAVRTEHWLALACDSEQAADHILHTVHAFSADGVEVLTVPRCREPRLVGPATLQCRAEAVDAQGRLRLWQHTPQPMRP
jgi:hypothetical protein